MVQLFILGSIYFVDNLYLFIFFAYVAQTLGGIGAGLNSTCAMAIITSCFPDDREDNIAILEAGVGIGMLLGPLLGALLYTIGGYMFPFYFVAFSILLLSPLLKSTIDFIEQREKEITQDKLGANRIEVEGNETDDKIVVVDTESGQVGEPEAPKPELEVTFTMLCAVPMFIFGLLSQVYIYAGIGFLAPTFSIHMVNNYEGFDEMWVGIFFAMPAVTYIINTPLVPYWCKLFGRKRTLLYGSIIFCLSVYFIGTSPLLSLPDSPKTIFIGTLMLGFSACMVTVPILPEMLHVIEHDLPHLKGDELNNVASGYFNSFLGVGETLGPISASILTEQFGFRTAFDIVATLILIYCIFFLIYIEESEYMFKVRRLISDTMTKMGVLSALPDTPKSALNDVEIITDPSSSGP